MKWLYYWLFDVKRTVFHTYKYYQRRRKKKKKKRGRRKAHVLPVLLNSRKVVTLKTCKLVYLIKQEGSIIINM